jgi:heme exporter protein D
MAAINHLGFIVAAYAAAVIIVAALVIWLMLDYRALRRTLADFDRRGISRRPGSEPPPPVVPAMEQARGDA